MVGVVAGLVGTLVVLGIVGVLGIVLGVALLVLLILRMFLHVLIVFGFITVFHMRYLLRFVAVSRAVSIAACAFFMRINSYPLVCKELKRTNRLEWLR